MIRIEIEIEIAAKEYPLLENATIKRENMRSTIINDLIITIFLSPPKI